MDLQLNGENDTIETTTAATSSYSEKPSFPCTKCNRVFYSKGGRTRHENKCMGPDATQKNFKAESQKEAITLMSDNRNEQSDVTVSESKTEDLSL